MKPMPELNIDGEVWKYEGRPLQAIALDDVGWAGRSNFDRLPAGESKEVPQLRDLNDALYWMRQWTSDEQYRAGYVLDFEAHLWLHNANVKNLEVRTFPH